MLQISTLHPTDGIPVPPDSVNILLLAAGTPQVMDWQAGAQIARFSGMTTGSGAFSFMVNLRSSGANVPSSGSSGGSTGIGHPVISQSAFQIPGNSTQFSVAALTSGYVLVEQWKK